MIRGPRRLEEVEIGAGCPGVIVQTNSFLRWNFAWEGSDGRVERVGVAEDALVSQEAISESWAAPEVGSGPQPGGGRKER